LKKVTTTGSSANFLSPKSNGQGFILRESEKKIVEDMGVIRKIAFSLLMVATLAHGQLSVDLKDGNITAPLQHQGKIEQQHFPEDIDRTYSYAQGKLLDENKEAGLQHPTTNSENLHRSTTNNQSNLRESANSRLEGFDYLLPALIVCIVLNLSLFFVFPIPMISLYILFISYNIYNNSRSGKNVPIFNGGEIEGGDLLSSRMMTETLLPMVYQAFDKFGAVDTVEEETKE
jgi:hypothetical protein